MIHTIQQSCLEKIKPDAADFKPQFTSASAFSYEQFAYQIVLFSDNPMGETAKIELKSTDEVKLYEVRQVPVNWPHYDHHTNETYLADKPCLLPDALFPLEATPTLRIAKHPTVLWVNVMAFALGDHDIDLYINGEYRSRFVLKVLPYQMTRSDLVNAQYIDPCSISRAHHVSLFCDRHWSLLGKYFDMASTHGVTHLLTPIYPPVYGDMPFGNDSTQLVRISKIRGDYEFNYDLLDSWIAIAKKNRINKFIFPPIIPSLKTLKCPKLKMTAEGKEVDVFTDETDVLSNEFFIFIRKFLRHLLKHLKQLNVHYDVAFQFTHAPSVEDEEHYCQCRSLLNRIIRGQQIADTLPTPEFIALNVGSAPFFSTAGIDAYFNFDINRHLFLDHETPDSIINTLIALPSTRIRSFGAICYRYKISSLFNLWFNYHPDSCMGMPDVFTDTTCKRAVPSGNGFLVYPGPDGPIASIRLKQLLFALQDLRRLQCLERSIPSKRIESLIDKYFKVDGKGIGLVPDNFLEFHEEICSLLQK